MSRVEEALRRTGAWVSAEADESLPGGENRGAQRALTIDEYPIEVAAAAAPVAAHQPGTHRADPVRSPATFNGANAAGARPLELVFVGNRALPRDIPPSTAEQYRRLGATLYQAQAEHGIKSVMLSSALPREGKTVTTANLALTLSESYRQRVLLIDTDLRGASIHTFFGIPVSPGLGDFLNDDERTVPIVAVSERLSVLPAGTSRNNPIAGLVSERMRQLLEYAKEEFDWVLLDTPPVALLSDANLLGRLTDAVVFVVAAGSTPYPVAQRALATLGPERILGVVLNKAPAASIPDSTYYERYSPQDGA